jgi:hypothetical protein
MHPLSHTIMHGSITLYIFQIQTNFPVNKMMMKIIIISKKTEGRYTDSITYCILPIKHRSHGAELDCGMRTADSLSTCNINVCDSSAVAAVASIPGTNSVCLTMPAVYAVRSGLSPVRAIHRTKCYCFPFAQLSTHWIMSISNEQFTKGRKEEKNIYIQNMVTSLGSPTCVTLTFEFRYVISWSWPNDMACTAVTIFRMRQVAVKAGIQVSQWGVEYYLPPYQISPAQLKWIIN